MPESTAVIPANSITPETVRQMSQPDRDATGHDRPRIPVCRPLLPDHTALTPYLQSIDRERYYTNGGALARDLTRRLGDAKGLTKDQVALTCSGTQGLILALRSVTAGPGLCMMPSWTFPATPAAAHWAGLTPWFVDIDDGAWALTPDRARSVLDRAPGPIAAVMPVSPFGAPPPTREWERFQDATGIPVVIDAAAAFDALEPSRVPAVVSLHATKALGVGEAGVVFSTNRAVVARINAGANFGFNGSRIPTSIGINGKVSEYGAAVGLAALDLWPERRVRWIASARRYRDALSDIVSFPPGFGEHAVATCVIQSLAIDAEQIQLGLASLGIESLRWWPMPCHRLQPYADPHHLPAPNSDTAASRAIGLPMSIDLSDADIDFVALAVRDLLGRRRSADMGSA